MTSLSEVAHIQQGKTLALKDMAGGGHPVYGANGVIGHHTEGHYCHPVVALGCRGSCGTVCLAPPGAWLANNVMAIWPRDWETIDLHFLALTLEHADLVGTGVISGQVQPQITRSSLQPLKVPVPPLMEQRRIADLIGAVDSAIGCAARSATTMRQALAQFLAVEVGGPSPGASVSPIGLLLKTSIGGVWGEDPGTSEVNALVYRSTEFSEWTAVVHETAATRSMGQRQLESRRLLAGDILMEKSGGTPTRPVGRVVWIDELPAPSTCSNFLQLLRPDADKVSPRYLLWALWSWHRQGVPFEYQTASTNIRNLKTKEYLQLGLNLPDRLEQDRVAALADALADQATLADKEVEALRALRSGLLSTLLSGEETLPESYDRFLEVSSR